MSQQEAEALAQKLLAEHPQAAYSTFWDQGDLYLKAERGEPGGVTLAVIGITSIAISDYGTAAIQFTVDRMREAALYQAHVADHEVIALRVLIKSDAIPKPEEWKRPDVHTII
ncbi:hypothetical protein [Deinococcus gobiensis]|nr:hypothetical protein [Deinococcus gobiensis]